MRRISLLTALLALVLAPTAADAAISHVIRGRGWGHGIGMSQYGAQGLAQHGASYREILARYYTGTEISTSTTETVRVLLQANRASISFLGATRASNRKLSPRRSYVAKAISGGRLEVRTDRGGLVGRYPAPLRISTKSDPIRLAGRAINGIVGGQYRGTLELRPSAGGGSTAVNALSLDDYVRGVVPDEMLPSWEPEALKAQALAARSYALATDRGGPVFDHYPDTRSQVYGGVGAEELSTNAAVEATSNEIVTYQGRPAATYFFSTSGGHTESVENVWYGQPVPYLKGVEDPYDEGSPYHRWQLTLTQSRMQAALRGLVKGTYRRIEIVERGESPRIVSADVVGSRGRTRVRGTTLRARLGLRDTWATFTTVTTEASRRAAGGATLLLGKMAATRALVGRIDPAPKRGRIVVERRTGGGWKRVARARTDRAGEYRVELKRAGVYRARAGAVSGPAVRVR